jgi:serine/threonine protein kinase
MPDVYRAPEVVLDMPWSYPIDIWSLGMVVSLCLNFALLRFRDLYFMNKLADLRE